MLYIVDTNYLDVSTDLWDVYQLEVVSLSSFTKNGKYNISLLVQHLQDMVQYIGTNINYFATIQSEIGLYSMDRTTRKIIKKNKTVKIKKMAISYS